MYELKKIGKVFTSKFVGTGLSSYKKIIYRSAVSQRLRNTALQDIALQNSAIFFITGLVNQSEVVKKCAP